MTQMLKKMLVLCLALVMVISLTACQSNKDEAEKTTETTGTTEATSASSEEVTTEPIEPVDMKVAALKGPTGMGMVKIMEDASQGTALNNYSFELMGSPDDLIGKVVNGEVDIAAVPTNLAMILYNKTEGAVQLAAVNTLGVLYVLENGETINSVADLKGKTVYTSGKGASPDFVFRYILEKNGLVPDKDVILDYKLEHADLAAAVVSGDADIALLPQPHATTALIKNENVRVALDITKEWEAVTEDQKLAMGVIIVQKEFAQAHPEAVEVFLDEYKASVDFVNSEIDSAASLIEKYEILPSAAIAKKAIPMCNIVYIDAMDAKAFLQDFYEILFNFEPKSIGGKLADEGFYYER